MINLIFIHGGVRPPCGVLVARWKDTGPAANLGGKDNDAE